MKFVSAIVQLTPEKARIEENLDRIADSVRLAVREGADLVCFAETIVSGYYLEGGVLECSLTGEELLAKLASRLNDLPKEVDVCLGFYEQAGGNLYNSAAYLTFGSEPKLVHVYRKFFLPTYNIFDEERFVSRGRELGVFSTRFGKIGLLICEDVWHSILSTLCAVAGAQMIIVPSASPARGFSGELIGNHDRYLRMIRAVAEEHGVFLMNPQLTGFEGGKGFIGGSTIVDPYGKILASAEVNEDSMILAEVDLTMVAVTRSQLPLVTDLQSAWGDIQDIVARLEP
jgi:N-carbamoylputrescine amidase